MSTGSILFGTNWCTREQLRPRECSEVESSNLVASLSYLKSIFFTVNTPLLASVLSLSIGYLYDLHLLGFLESKFAPRTMAVLLGVPSTAGDSGFANDQDAPEPTKSQEAESSKKASFTSLLHERVIIVIGGQTAAHASQYLSPSDIRECIEAPRQFKQEREIQLHHILEYYFECHGNSSALVYHFMCPDANESLDEVRNSMYKRGQAHALTSDEIAKRVGTILADPIFANADTMGKLSFGYPAKSYITWYLRSRTLIYASLLGRNSATHTRRHRSQSLYRLCLPTGEKIGKCYRYDDRSSCAAHEARAPDFRPDRPLIRPGLAWARPLE